MSLNRPDIELLNIEYENELKNIFIKNFKMNIDDINSFVNESIYKILINKYLNNIN
jgi:hypothetical protein